MDDPPSLISTACYRDRYADFTVKHFHEQLVKRHGYGLGYTVTAFYRSMPEAGMMAFYIGTTPDKVEQAQKGFAKIIGDIREKPLSAALLEAGANRLLGAYYRDRQSLGSREADAASDALLGRPYDFERQLIEKAAKLTPAQVQAVAKKYLDEANAYKLVLLP